MIFKLACGDVMPGCTTTFESTDKDRLMEDVATHAAAAHDITDITPEVYAAIDERVQRVPA